MASLFKPIVLLRAGKVALSRIFDALKRAQLARAPRAGDAKPVSALPDRRRSARWAAHVPVFVYGHTAGWQPFHEEASGKPSNQHRHRYGGRREKEGCEVPTDLMRNELVQSRAQHAREEVYEHEADDDFEHCRQSHGVPRYVLPPPAFTSAAVAASAAGCPAGVKSLRPANAKLDGR